MIEIKNLSKAFGEKKVLENFSATLSDDINCLFGVSGTGKTTLINIIAGLIKQDSGEITGIESKRISIVFQENRLIESLSAVKNVALVCEKADNEKIITLLEDLGLKGSCHSPVSTLSGGMKRRVAIARALINPADIYIFDEPFEGLDDKRVDSVLNIIKQKTQNAISIYITHDIEEIESLNPKIIYM